LFPAGQVGGSWGQSPFYIFQAFGFQLAKPMTQVRAPFQVSLETSETAVQKSLSFD
jgi:hypothetical protein